MLRETIESWQFGAIPDTGGDASPAISLAIEKAAETGINSVALPAGTCTIKTPITYRDNVSINGDNTRLLWKPNGNIGGAVIDTTNKTIRKVVFSGFVIERDPSITAPVTGILCGSTLAKYNSAETLFFNLTFRNLTGGLMGNGAADVGLFDAQQIACWYDGCDVGFAPYGSQNVVIAPRVTLCGTGFRWGYLSGESMAGGEILGGRFIQNGYDFDAPDANGFRKTKIDQTWFEQSIYGIWDIPNAGTLMRGLSMTDCLIQSNTETNSLMDFSNAIGKIVIDRPDLAKNTAVQSVEIVAPTSPNGHLIVRDPTITDETGSIDLLKSILTESAQGVAVGGDIVERFNIETESGACYYRATNGTGIAFFGISGANDGAFGTLSANPFMLFTNNTLAAVLEVGGRFYPVGALGISQKRVASLPATGNRNGDKFFCPDLRVIDSNGNLQSSGNGTGGTAEWNGAKWCLAGTDITATA